MMNIIASEFYKMLRNKVCAVIALLFLALNMLGLAASIYGKYSPSISQNMKESMGSTGFASYISSYSGDALFYIIAIFTACVITAEYASGSIRQMSCHGIARWKLLLGQYIVVFATISLILIGFGVFNLATDTLLYQLGSIDAGAFIRMNLGLLSLFFCISAFATFFSFLFRNSGITIAISLAFILLSNFALSALSLLTKKEFFLYYSLQAMREMILDLSCKPNDILRYCIVLIISGMIALASSILLFTKRDID